MVLPVLDLSLLNANNEFVRLWVGNFVFFPLSRLPFRDRARGRVS